MQFAFNAIHCISDYYFIRGNTTLTCHSKSFHQNSADEFLMRGTSVQEVKEVGGLHHAYPDSHTTMRTYPVLWDKSGLIAYTGPAKKCGK